MEGTFNVGDRVIRKADLGNGKTFYGKVGTIERVFMTNTAYTTRQSKPKVRVCWHNATARFSGGYSDMSTNMDRAAVVLATDENLARMNARKAERRAKWEAYHAKLNGKSND